MEFKEQNSHHLYETRDKHGFSQEAQHEMKRAREEKPENGSPPSCMFV